MTNKKIVIGVATIALLAGVSVGSNINTVNADEPTYEKVDSSTYKEVVVVEKVGELADLEKDLVAEKASRQIEVDRFNDWIAQKDALISNLEKKITAIKSKGVN